MTLSPKQFSQKIGALALLLSFLVVPAVFAQETTDDLQRQLQEIQRQISGVEGELKAIQGEKTSLANRIAALGKQQSALALQIKASDLRVADIEKRLAKTQANIDANQSRRGRLRDHLSELLWMIDRTESRSVFYAMAETGNLLDGLNQIQDMDRLTDALNETAIQVKDIGVSLAEEEAKLEIEEEEAENLLNQRMLQRAELKQATTDHQALLKEAKSRENSTQTALADVKAQANEIRSRMYQLLGITGKVTFEQALKTAEWAGGATDVRPAFLLAILTQESNLGGNVGTCNRPGDPESKSWRVIMKPTRDHEPFKTIMAELGRDPDITPVSCPMKDARGNQVGWGGAMGPAQFIPSTWMGYAPKVKKLTGNATADPWDIRDAFAATSLKVGADGAAAGTRQGEWNAAMKYFSGSTNVRFRFYGDNVLKLADKYQADIDALK